MRVVLDTNLLVAAFVARGSCNELLEHCIVHHEVILSKFILEELQETLIRKFDFSQDEARAVVRLLCTRAQIVDPVPLPTPVCRDPDDDSVLATAQTGEFVAVVTGDKDLTVLQRHGRARILTPSEFWAFETDGVLGTGR